MNEALTLFVDIKKASKTASDKKIDELVLRQRSLSFFNSIKFKYYVNKGQSKNIYQLLWKMIWW